MFRESVFHFRKDRTVDYPSQSKRVADDATLAGELRLYYGVDQLRPKSSTYGCVRMRVVPNDKLHNGVDIYAPAFPLPHEVPLLAVCDGTITQKFMDQHPNDMGHRVQLSPKGGGTERIIYGHLSRFEGPERSVKSGDVIGYVGCSGNADNDKSCSNFGSHNITSAHVHFGWMTGIDENTLDPLQKMGWKLRFQQPLTPIELPDWELDKLEEKPSPASVTGVIVVKPLRNQNAKSGDLAPHLRRVAWIERASQKALEPTLDCYAEAEKRLSKPEPVAKEGKFHDFGLDGFGYSLREMENIGQRITAIRAELEKVAGEVPSVGTTDPPDVRRAHGPLQECLFIAIRAVWHAAGGHAIRRVAANPRKTKNAQNVKVDVPGGPWQGKAPDGAFGLNGHSLAHLYANGIAAMHVSRLTSRAEGSVVDVPYSAWTLVAGFGRGSGENAVFDANLLKAFEGGNASLKAAAEAVAELANAQIDLSRHIGRVQPSISPAVLTAQIMGLPGGDGGYLVVIDTLRSRLDTARTALASIAPADRKDWLLQLASSGRAAAKAAHTMLIKPNPKKKPSDPDPPRAALAQPNIFTVFSLGELPPPLAPVPDPEP